MAREGYPCNPTGVKHDAGKPRIELISTIATIEKAKVMGHGAQKYGVDNWRKGLSWLRVIGALLRHTFAYLGGENNDQETGLSHMAHAACCVDFLLEYEKTHPELDDRPHTKAIPTFMKVPAIVQDRNLCCGTRLDSQEHASDCVHVGI